MSPRRRTFLMAAGALSLAPSVLRAQTPLPPVRILVGFAAGGAVDVVARAIADAMRPLLARNVIVENKPGAAGRLVLEAVRAAPPDGDTLMMVPHGPMTLFQMALPATALRPCERFFAGRARLRDRLRAGNWRWHIGTNPCRLHCVGASPWQSRGLRLAWRRYGSAFSGAGIRAASGH